MSNIDTIAKVESISWSKKCRTAIILSRTHINKRAGIDAVEAMVKAHDNTNSTVLHDITYHMTKENLYHILLIVRVQRMFKMNYSILV